MNFLLLKGGNFHHSGWKPCPKPWVFLHPAVQWVTDKRKCDTSIPGAENLQMSIGHTSKCWAYLKRESTVLVVDQVTCKTSQLFYFFISLITHAVVLLWNMLHFGHFKKSSVNFKRYPIWSELNCSCVIIYSSSSIVDLLLVQPRTIQDAEYSLQSKTKPLPVWFSYPV